jgi:hypothetical protein
MRTALFFVALLGLVSPVAAQRQALGIYFQWGAFREEAPRRCFAIAEPHRSPKPGEWRPFGSVSFWPGKAARGQVHFRLSRTKRPGSAVLLRIDDRTFQLLGGGTNAWAPDRRADAEIVTAMRSGIDMTVETRSDRGALVRDYYQLRGAATAIDAAAVACARRA